MGLFNKIKSIASSPKKIFSALQLSNPTILGGAMGIGSQFAGDYLGYKAQKKGITQQAHQAELDRAANLQMFRESQAQSNEHFLNNMAMQKDFAKNGILWQAEQAKELGIHPLASLGAQGPSYVPGQIPQNNPPYSSNKSRGAKNFARSDFYSKMGQNFSSAISRTLSGPQRIHNMKMQELAIENSELDNQIKRINLQQATKELNGPTGPVVTPSEITDSKIPGIARGIVPEVQWSMDPHGVLRLQSSEDYMRRALEIPFKGLQHSFRNDLAPMFRKWFTGKSGMPNPAREFPPPKHHYWAETFNGNWELRPYTKWKKASRKNPKIQILLQEEKSRALRRYYKRMRGN